MQTKVGQIAFKAPEFIVAQIVGGEPEGEMKSIGFSILGPAFDGCEIFPDVDTAVAAARRLLQARAPT